MKSMKAIMFAVLLGLGGILIQATPAEEATPVEESTTQGIEFFEGSWDEAKAKAAEEGKLIFLDAYASWCGPCKILKRNVFTDGEVGTYFNDHFINYEMDMERGVGRRVAQEYKVTAYPTLIFVDADGNIVQKAIGYHAKEQLIELGNTAMQKHAL